MTEQNQAEQFDPSAHTVDEVNAYLADADEAERQRVLQAEADGKDRATVKAPEAHEDAPQADEGTKPKETKAETFKEAAKHVPQADGEKYQKGYEGYVPSRDGDNPVDLSLAAVTKGA